MGRSCTTGHENTDGVPGCGTSISSPDGSVSELSAVGRNPDSELPVVTAVVESTVSSTWSPPSTSSNEPSGSVGVSAAQPEVTSASVPRSATVGRLQRDAWLIVLLLVSDIGGPLLPRAGGRSGSVLR